MSGVTPTPDALLSRENLGVSGLHGLKSLQGRAGLAASLG
jgi:hypothetical protein